MDFANDSTTNKLILLYVLDKMEIPLTENSILEIAIDCGFSSATYFNRVFRNFFGCAPSVYRKFLDSPHRRRFTNGSTDDIIVVTAAKEN